MEYKDYIESSYRIVQALEYLQGDLKTNINNQLLEVLEQAYQETASPTFKIFLELKREFPDITYAFDSKTCLTKQKTKLKLLKSYNKQEDCPFHVSPEEPFRLEHNEERVCFKGVLFIERRIWGRIYKDDFSLGDTVGIEFINHKTYDEVEMRELIQHLRGIRD
jgi:hypothetical protein